MCCILKLNDTYSMTKNLLTLTILLLSISCTITTTKKEREKSIREFKERIKKYDPSFVDHFPSNLNTNDNISFIERSAQTFGETSIFLSLYDADSMVVSKLKDKLTRNAIANYHPNDSSLLVLNRFTDTKNLLSIRSARKSPEMIWLIDSVDYKNKYPVPNFFFSRYSTPKTISRLPADFRLYVIDAKPGRFWENKYLSNGKFMPEKWKNGYSKGIAIDQTDRNIIYWFAIW